MAASVKITCDGNGCVNSISNYGTTDDVQGLLEWNNWHTDLTTDEFHYCTCCWPAVRAEYEEMHTNGELSSNDDECRSN